jgi:hypothetical protein
MGEHPFNSQMGLARVGWTQKGGKAHIARGATLKGAGRAGGHRHVSFPASLTFLKELTKALAKKPKGGRTKPGRIADPSGFLLRSLRDIVVSTQTRQIGFRLF